MLVGQRYVTVAHEVARVAPVSFFLSHSFGRRETGDLGALKAVVGGSGHENAGASDDVAKDLLGTRAWGIEYNVGPLTRKAEKAGNFSPGSQADHPAKGGPLVAQGIMPVLLSVFVAVSAYESVVPVRVNDRVGGGVRKWYRRCRVGGGSMDTRFIFIFFSKYRLF